MPMPRLSFLRDLYLAAERSSVLAPLRRALRWTLSELAAFLLALLPLAAPLYVVAFFGSVSLPFWGQLIVGSLFLPLIFLLALFVDARVQRVAQFIGSWLGAAVSILLLLLLPGFWILNWLGALDFFDRMGGFPTLFAIIAVGLLLVALALRLFGFATKLLRIAIALLVGAIVFYYLAKVGLAPGWSALHAVQRGLSWTWGIACLVALAAILRWLQARLGSATARQQLLSQFGSLAAFLSALFILASFAWALAFNNPFSTHIDSFGGTVNPGTPAAGFTGLENQQLAELFVPVLQLTEDEQWPPSDVDRYVRKASLLNADGKPTGRVLREASDLPRTCPAGTAFPCWILDCPKCAVGRSSLPRNERVQGVAYVHVIRAHGKGAQPSVFDSADRFAPGLSVILQYWLFYDYDRWKTRSFLGQLTQGHSGDWEEVTVRTLR